MSSPPLWDVVRLVNLSACVTVIVLLVSRRRWIRSLSDAGRLLALGVGGMAFGLGQASLLLLLPPAYSPEGLRVLTLTVALTWVVMALVRARRDERAVISTAPVLPPRAPSPSAVVPEPPHRAFPAAPPLAAVEQSPAFDPYREAMEVDPHEWLRIVHGQHPDEPLPTSLPPAPVQRARRGRHADPPEV